jgi:FKBP-type peptidyl-prolyl cis-trans isomerase FklB
MIRKAFPLLCLVLLVASPAGARNKTKLADGKEKLSYSIGVDVGRNLKQQGIDVDPDLLARGLKDALSGRKALMTDDEVRDVLMAFQREAMVKQQEHVRQVSEKFRKEGEAFLDENGKKDGVVTLPSGLQYQVIEKGKGPSPKATDTVEVHYRGTLTDGTEFDSSYKRGMPATFPVNGVIAGWTEALKIMKVGSKWRLFIPAKLAYGERGAGRDIPPNAALVFEVELLGIK